jgi:hypothetical protein
MDHFFNLPQAFNLPQDIKSKILLYYLSYGSPSANIMREKIKDTTINQTNSLWFANVDYTYNNKKYMLHKSIGCPFEVLCDLRLAIIDNNILNGPINVTLKGSQKNIIKNKYTLTKNILLQLLEED